MTPITLFTAVGLVPGTVRTEVGDFLAALLLVYTLILIAYIVANLIFAFGARMPYNRWSGAILDFLRDVSEPYLKPFRRLGLSIGPLDLSPMLAILLLQIVGGLIVSLVRG